ncbi:hypothetical protein MKX01_001276 [Papaver californicum]|nr:hypothetical protein MKX01_001276 [Papaver californicum]
MAAGGSSNSDVEINYDHQPLLLNTTTSSSGSGFIEGVVDYRGEKVSNTNRYKFGGWRSASFIITAEMGETVANYGIASNLINYLTGPLGQSTVLAAANVNVWAGVMWILPLFGAFIADSYLGRFRTVFFSSLIYVLGLGLITISAVLPAHECPNDTANNAFCSSASSFKVIFFFTSLYLVAVGKAGFKPCAEAFGADQFDGQNPEERESKSSFFNWWYFGLCISSSFSLLILTYVQDNLNWGLGFGIPCISMAFALIGFLLGRKIYRYSLKEDKQNPLLGIAQVFIAAAKNWRITSSSDTTQLEEDIVTLHHYRVGAHQFKFLDKALIDTSIPMESRMNRKPCSIRQVEDAKVVLRLVPIWTTCLIYAVVVAQSTTFFTKQGHTMDRLIGSNIQIPPASLQALISLSIIFFMPIYDRVFVPFARNFTGEPNGITMLQRLGCGMFLSTLAMVVAAVVEKKRLQTALDFGFIDMPKETVPMSVWWLIPQYLLLGLTEVLTMVGLQEFFYDQVPDGLKSMGVSIYLSIFGVGNFLSGFLISVIEKVTSGSGRHSWFPDNLNRAHLDYFYWFLAVLSAVDLVAYLYFSNCYVYLRKAPA